ncbi:uncharacterized protein TRUGW13939_07649 [Talaromyces rugulosus]|uniref:Restriction of telomere capping protein 4 C-terminal domain-containing protein n=1 Tax=Talaromyces rugulosus TaxID=121627 RepID=A0A7H8R293_TALRU|nr:uncharacterized protein TRUGW13939_07649 [Talaromyces rugulosus]QKX60504.1 hypothetical protein TRUGW13939_07649 [Talaromyces rugulosus]
MGRKLTEEERQKRRTARAFNDDKTAISSDPAHRKPEEGTARRYKRQWEEWLTYCRTHPGTKVEDLNDHQTAKHYIEWVAKGIQPQCPEDDDPSVGSVMLAWKDTSAMYLREKHTRLQAGMTKSILNYIQDILVDKVPLRTTRRQRKYLTTEHFKVLLSQLWGKDWYEFEYPIYRHYLSALLKLLMFSSGRIGEYVESNSRRASGRGMYRADILFLVAQNGKGRPEIFSRAKRDPKGQTRQKHRHPRCAVYEDIGEMPLYLNPVMDLVIIALAQDAFRDFTSVDEIFALRPNEGLPYQLALTEPNRPFFEKMSRGGPTGEILTADWLFTELKKLCSRAGYPRHFTGHDIRAEALVKADQHGYSVDERMTFAAHTNPRTFFESYASPTSTVDGVQNIFENLTRRTDHLDIFRGWSLPRHPRLWQALPAKLQFDLAYSPEALAIDNELAALGELIRKTAPWTQCSEYKTRRQNMYRKRHQLVITTLKTWQASLLDAVPGRELEGASADHHWTVFDRSSHLVPERRRLSSSLFLEVAPRTPEARTAWQDMEALARRRTPVVDIPGLEARGNCCPVTACAKPLEKMSTRERWRHVFGCGRKDRQRRHGFAQFCWLGCARWFTAEADWEEHCQGHLDADDWPVQWGLLIFEKSLAVPGTCPWCRLDTTKSAATRLRQFWDQKDFSSHIEAHLVEYQASACIRCPAHETWHCASSTFTSVLDLRCHLQDTHCHLMTGRRTRAAGLADEGPARLTGKGRKRKFSVSTPESFSDTTTAGPRKPGRPHKRRTLNVSIAKPVPSTPAETACRSSVDPPSPHNVSFRTQDQDVRCPVCGDAVDAGFWKALEFDVAAAPVRKQLESCAAHRRTAAQREWLAKGLPIIDWKDLDARLARFHFQVYQILESGNLARFADATERETPQEAWQLTAQCRLSHAGYYGPRGVELLLDHVMSRFRKTISDSAAAARLGTGISPLIVAQVALLPELLSLLVQEDLLVDEEEARRILEETAEMGRLLNPSD